MRLLLDFLPIALFFAAFKAWGIFVATAVAIAASVIQIAWLRLRRLPVDNMQWVSLGIIVVFGGMTLLLRDETFIKWKPSVIYWLFALALAGARILAGKNLVKSMMGRQVRLPDGIWARLNIAWIVFFSALGALNLFVAYRFSTDIWVDFKLFGALGLTVAFVVGQALWFSRHIEQEDA